MQYTSVAAVSEYLGITSNDDDALISILIDSAGDWLDRETRRLLVTDTDSTVYMDAIGAHIEGKTLHLYPFGDLSAITTVTNGDATTIDSAAYTTYPKALTTKTSSYTRIKILDSSALYWTYTTDWENAISITGKWALYADTAPDDVEQMTKLLASFLYRQKDPGMFETIVIPAEGIASVPKGFPTSVAYWVKRMRRP